MSDKVILVTGATDGIGKQTALELAQQGATVLVHGRNPARGAAVVEEIQSTTGNDRVSFVQADFASLAQVRQLAETVKELTPRLDVLIHNAGLIAQQRQLTEDGLETTFQVNHLASFLLTHLLLDTLKASAPSRIVVVSSTLHRQGQLDFGNLQQEKHFNAYDAYNLSKLANVLFAVELAERLAGVTVNALHPGAVTTKLLKEAFNTTGISLEEGAATSVYLAAAPEIEGITGKYFVRKREAPMSVVAQDKAARQRLWEESERLVGLLS